MNEFILSIVKEAEDVWRSQRDIHDLAYSFGIRKGSFISNWIWNVYGVEV